MPKALHIPLAISLALLFAACDENRLYEEYKAIPGKTWDRNNKISFETNIEDTAQVYNVYINVRHTGDYAYSNLYIFLTTTFPDGTQVRDTLNCTLQDETGRWMGEGLGDLWDNHIVFKPLVKFSRRGKYVFEYEQAMRQEKLEGIADVGLRIEKAR